MKVDANGSTFNCRIDGDHGPWVMLSHGLATDLTMWDELTEALRDRYRILRYDARSLRLRNPGQLRRRERYR